MRTFARFSMVLALLVIVASTTGCFENLVGPPRKAHTVFWNNTPERLLFHDQEGGVYEMGPGHHQAYYLNTSVEYTVTITWPDGKPYRTIRFRPDAELGDATCPDGTKVDTIVYFSGSVQRAITPPQPQTN